MQRVRLHTAGNGLVWALSRCKCGNVDKHLVADAIDATIVCKRCGHAMDMKVSTVEALVTQRVGRGTSSPSR